MTTSANTASQVKKFEVGQSYSCRSVCDHDCVWTFKIVARTEKTISTECGQKFRINAKLTAYENVEALYPLGNFSMCPILTANKVVQ